MLCSLTKTRILSSTGGSAIKSQRVMSQLTKRILITSSKRKTSLSQKIPTMKKWRTGGAWKEKDIAMIQSRLAQIVTKVTTMGLMEER